MSLGPMFQGATRMLLLADSTVVLVVAVIGLLCLTVVGLVALLVGTRAKTPAPAPPTWPPFPMREPTAQRERPAPRVRPSAVRPVEIDVPTKDVDTFVNALRTSGWMVRETGEVVATEDDEEGLTTLSVDVPSGGAPRSGSGEEVQ